MNIILGLFGIAAALALVIKREAVGDMLGDAEWMQKVGGVYNFTIILAVFIFFWSIAFLTNTTGVFFYPLKFILPGLFQQNAVNPVL